MKELPTPTQPLAQDFVARSSAYFGLLGAREPRAGTPPRSPAPAATQRLLVQWAQSTEDVRAAQRLRFDVFAREMGARLETAANALYPGHDIDLYDDFWEHLLVRDNVTRAVVGIYRVAATWIDP